MIVFFRTYVTINADYADQTREDRAWSILLFRKMERTVWKVKG